MISEYTITESLWLAQGPTKPFLWKCYCRCHMGLKSKNWDWYNSVENNSSIHNSDTLDIYVQRWIYIVKVTVNDHSVHLLMGKEQLLLLIKWKKGINLILQKCQFNMNSKINPKKKEQCLDVSQYLASNYVLQSHSNRNSMVMAQNRHVD